MILNITISGVLFRCPFGSLFIVILDHQFMAIRRSLHVASVYIQYLYRIYLPLLLKKNRWCAQRVCVCGRERHIQQENIPNIFLYLSHEAFQYTFRVFADVLLCRNEPVLDEEKKQRT